MKHLKYSKDTYGFYRWVLRIWKETKLLLILSMVLLSGCASFARSFNAGLAPNYRQPVRTYQTKVYMLRCSLCGITYQSTNIFTRPPIHNNSYGRCNGFGMQVY